MWRRQQVSSLDLLVDAVLLLIKQLLLWLRDVPAVRLGIQPFFGAEITVFRMEEVRPGGSDFA
jgi:hypothetical protein